MFDGSSPPVSIDRELCVRGRFRICDSCEKACPAGALLLGQGVPELIPEACVSCGACATACPAGALRDQRLTERDLIGLGEKNALPRLGLTCSKNPSPPADARRMTCLGRLSPGALLAILANGTDEIEIFRPDCQACAWSAAGAVLDQSLASFDALLDKNRASAMSLLVRDAGKPLAEGEVRERGGHRRGMIKRALLWAGNLVLSSLPLKDRGDDAAPSPREELVAALRRVPLRSEAVAREKIPFAMLDVNSSCDGCGACERACLYKAIEVENQQGAPRVLFHPEACTGCGGCIEACRPGSLQLAPTIRPALVLERTICLFEGTPGESCARCGAGVSKAGELCALCQKSGSRGFVGLGS